MRTKAIFQQTQECPDDFEPPVYPKMQQDLERIMSLLRQSFLTKQLDQQDHQMLANAMSLERFSQNDLIIRYGDPGDKYYVLKSG